MITRLAVVVSKMIQIEKYVMEIMGRCFIARQNVTIFFCNWHQFKTQMPLKAKELKKKFKVPQLHSNKISFQRSFFWIFIAYAYISSTLFNKKRVTDKEKEFELEINIIHQTSSKPVPCRNIPRQVHYHLVQLIGVHIHTTFCFSHTTHTITTKIRPLENCATRSDQSEDIHTPRRTKVQKSIPCVGAKRNQFLLVQIYYKSTFISI